MALVYHHNVFSYRQDVAINGKISCSETGVLVTIIVQSIPRRIGRSKLSLQRCKVEGGQQHLFLEPRAFWLRISNRYIWRNGETRGCTKRGENGEEAVRHHAWNSPKLLPYSCIGKTLFGGVNSKAYAHDLRCSYWSTHLWCKFGLRINVGRRR